MLLEHMHKKFEINRTKIKGGCQSGRKMIRPYTMEAEKISSTRGKLLLELWVTTFLPDLNFLCMCTNSMASAHVILK